MGKRRFSVKVEYIVIIQPHFTAAAAQGQLKEIIFSQVM
jgi:hypothetical protein